MQTRSNKTINMHMVYLVFSAAFIISSAFGTFYTMGYRFNFSESFPFGIYREINTDHYVPGDLVIFCPPKKEVFSFAMNQGFLLRGSCVNGSMPLLKKVAGVPGDKIVVREAVYINDLKQKNSEIQIFPYKAKDVTLKSDNYFLLSDFCKMSFDSRYFGPIEKSQITSKVEAIFTWK